MVRKKTGKYIDEYNWHVRTRLLFNSDPRVRKPNSYERCNAIIDDSKSALRHAQNELINDYESGYISYRTMVNANKRVLSHNAIVHKKAYKLYPFLKSYKHRGN